MANEDNQGQTGFSVSSARGATVETYGVRRRVRVIGVLESELDEISSLNSQAATIQAAAWALVSLAVGIWVSAVFTERLNDAGKLLAGVGGPLVFIFAILFFRLSNRAATSRTSTVNRMKAESEPMPPPGAG